MMICWIPAVIIAAAQFGDWWHPVLVTIIFVSANNIDGMIIAPKIVGESVGLHPLTVIISVLAWSLILGGLLGALLAVPAHRHAESPAQTLLLGSPAREPRADLYTPDRNVSAEVLAHDIHRGEIETAGLQPAHSKHVESRAKGTVSQTILADPKLAEVGD